MHMPLSIPAAMEHDADTTGFVHDPLLYLNENL